MVFKKEDLLKELTQMVNSHIDFVVLLTKMLSKDLQKKKDEISWSAVECISHLNLYAKFYNKEIRKRIEGSYYPNSAVFKAGYLGNKFALDMLPKKRMKTMQTFKSKNPIYSTLVVDEVLQNFLELQNELLELLKLAEGVDISKTKTSITLPFLKLRLGDTFRFVIYHNERHIVQARKAL